jgi:hypothetical protein
MKQQNQSGIAAISTLLILASLLILAGASAYVYSKNHDGSLPFMGPESTPVVYENNSNSTSPNGIPGGVTSAPQATPPNSSNTTVVKIPDAGIQITVPNSLKDLTYHTVKAADGTITATFSTKTLATAVPSCAANQNNGAFDAIVRGNGQYPGPAPRSGGLIKQYGSFYIAYLLPTGPCAKGMTPANQNLVDSQSQEFYTALSTVQAL